MIKKSVFGTLKDGRNVEMHALKNSHGMEVRIIDYGAAVASIIVPDRTGTLSDVVLGYDDLEGYVNGTAYLGATVGRYANRIAKGKLLIDGKSYQLGVNNGENTLHGGKVGFNKRLWKSEPVEDGTGSAVKMTYVSPDGEEGFPGTVTLIVKYSLTDDNELRIDYEGMTDKPTVLNPSHHSYFNLSGIFTKEILDHVVRIDADAYTPAAADQIPTGRIGKVDGTPLDFRKPTPVGSRINDEFEQLKLAKGYDHNWVLNDFTGKVREVANVLHPTTGRFLQVFTDQPGMQFYSGNHLDGTQKGKGGVVYKARTALCLEAQHYPDSPNHPDWPPVVLIPGDTYRQTTVYRFSTKQPERES